MPPNEFNSSPLFLPVDIVNLDSLMAVQRAIVLWSRLELLPVTADLSQGLQAPVADPLWFLGRQWQFAEFQGEDAGTPIMARLEGEAAHLSRYSPGSEGKNAVDYQDIHIPLEVVVEREAIHPVHPRLAAEAGEHFIRLLAFHGVTGVRTALQKNFALAIPDQDLPHPQADPKGKLWQTLFAGSALDGRKLAAALRTLVGSTGALTGLPTEFSFAAGRKPEVMTASVEWLHWYEGHISEPDETVKSAWIPQRQE